MPGPELAQYGIATFAVAGLIFIVNKFLIEKTIMIWQRSSRITQKHWNKLFQ